VYEETQTGRPHDTSVQKDTSDNEKVDAVSLMSWIMFKKRWKQLCKKSVAHQDQRKRGVMYWRTCVLND